MLIMLVFLPHAGGGVYSAAFRPIQQHPEGDSSSNIPTLVPTPLRNSRPPLLETPPGFRYMSQGLSTCTVHVHVHYKLFHS